MPSPEFHPVSLFRNHLEFLRTHRGNTHFEDDIFYVDSDKKAFTFAVPLPEADISGIIDSYPFIYLFPNSAQLEKQLEENGFQSKMTYHYMTLNAGSSGWKTNADVEVRLAATEEDFEVFSEVQVRGFNEDEETYQAWHPWIREANFRNIHNPYQKFYIGYLDEKPLGVSLSVYHENLAGIYAVATLPAARRTGLATSIMKRAVEDAIEAGFANMTLQVIKGSYAESFYTALGFQSAFYMKIFSR